MDLGSLAAVLPRNSEIVALALTAFGLPMLLFEVSLRTRTRSRKRGLRLSAEARGDFVRVQWVAVAVQPRDIQGYRVVRQSETDNRRVTWTIAERNQTALDDWGIVAGERYGFTVEMYLKNRQGDADFVVGDVSVTVPTVNRPREAHANP